MNSKGYRPYSTEYKRENNSKDTHLIPSYCGTASIMSMCSCQSGIQIDGKVRTLIYQAFKLEHGRLRKCFSWDEYCDSKVRINGGKPSINWPAKVIWAWIKGGQRYLHTKETILTGLDKPQGRNKQFNEENRFNVSNINNHGVPQINFREYTPS